MLYSANRYGFNSSCLTKKTTRSSHSSVQPFPHGLYDKSDPHFYRRKLSLPDAANILDNSMLFWNAVKADVDFANAHRVAEDMKELTADDYLNNVWHRRSAFLRSGVLEDREEVLLRLNSLLRDSAGRFVLYLGGKSTGKSTTLCDIVRRTTDKNDSLYRLPISLVDGRVSSDLSKLLLNALPPDFVSQYLGHHPPPTLRRIWAQCKKHISTLFPFIPKVGNLLNETALQSPPHEILQSYISFNRSKSIENIPIIIIDEADRFLEDAEHDCVKRQQLKDLLEFFTRSTKQRHDLHVILAASEYAFRHRLDSIGGNFSANFTDCIFAGEIPPGSMYKVLTLKWAMGDNLASVFLNCYGGHLWMCSLAVDALRERKEEFSAGFVLKSPTSCGISSCLASRSKDMRSMLVAVAEDGYYPLNEKDDPLAKEASQKNVVGIVDALSLVVGVPLDVRKNGGSWSGVVPTSQVTRLMIARELAREGMDG